MNKTHANDGIKKMGRAKLSERKVLGNKIKMCTTRSVYINVYGQHNLH